MNEQERRELLGKLMNLRLACVEVGSGETNQDAWRRHLAAHPYARNANIRIFNHHQQRQPLKKVGGSPRGIFSKLNN